MAEVVDPGMLEADIINHGMTSEEATAGSRKGGCMTMRNDVPRCQQRPGEAGAGRRVVPRLGRAATPGLCLHWSGHCEAGMMGAVDANP